MQREKIAKQRSRKLVYQFDKEGEQLENYTKYKLKSNDELAELLADKDHLFVVACNKCFKEFETIEEPECGEFEKFAAEQGKTVTGSVKVDFLCNKTQTEKKITGYHSGGNRKCYCDLLRTGYSDSCRPCRQACICCQQLSELYRTSRNGSDQKEL